MSISLLTAGYAIFALTASGFSPVFLECCPRFSGQLYSISNTWSTVAGVACPLTVDALVSALGESAGWRASFTLFGLGIGIPASCAFCQVGEGRERGGSDVPGYPATTYCNNHHPARFTPANARIEPHHPTIPRQPTRPSS